MTDKQRRDEKNRKMYSDFSFQEIRVFRSSWQQELCFTPHTHNAVGHEVMPVELPTAVIPLVEVLHLGDQVLQLCGQRDENLLTAS